MTEGKPKYGNDELGRVMRERECYREALEQIRDGDFVSVEGMGSPFGAAVRERARLALENGP